jgi:ABC-2 type transport system ATP-binding protein
MDAHAAAAPALVATGLRKRFGATQAVDGLDVTVAQGEIVGLIGPDGAGKTTTMRMVLGLLRPDAGEIQILGRSGLDRHGLKERLGYMPQRFSLYPDLTVIENLRFFADLYLVPAKERARREGELLEFSRLAPFRSRRAGALSGGMKQKLALSCNLVHRPDLLVLDEPTTGVDPVSRQEFWEWLRRYASEGLAILVSTPYMDEAALCDRVLLVHHGRVPARGTPTELTERYPGGLLEVAASQAPVVRQVLPDAEVVRFGDMLHVSHASGQAQHVQDELARRGVEAHLLAPTIEDVFVALTTADRERS